MVPPIELDLPATPLASALARAGLRPICDAIPSEASVDLCIIVSELIAAAVRHARISGLDEITVRAAPNDVGVHVEITDAGPGFDFSIGARSEGMAWGPFVMRRLASDWGVARRGEHTTVWFDVAA
jgi:anti-sigma regulatory factor (Ser/Thr protein kinase)